MSHSSPKVFRPTKSTPRLPEHIWGFDIETKGDTNEFVLSCFTHEQNYTYPNMTISDAWVFTKGNTNLSYKARVATTNLGFDFLKTFQQFDDWHMIERDGKIYECNIAQRYDTRNKRQRVVRFIDTVNIYPAPVAVLAESVNLKKLPHPQSFGKQPKNIKQRDELVIYCAQDALISARFIKEQVLTFCKQWNIGLKKTIASMGISVIRRHFLDEQLPVESPIVHDRCFAAYYGGRTEVFQRGEFTDVTCYDYNSLYPWTMLQPLPHPKYGYATKKVTMHDIFYNEGVAQVTVTVPSMYLPPLPYRDQRLLFPTGTFSGYYTFVELRHAISKGVSIDDIQDGVVYTRSKPFLRHFASTMYQQRLEKKQDGQKIQLMYKLCMNAPYGKFAFNYRKSTSIYPNHQVTPDMLVEAEQVDQRDGYTILTLANRDDPPDYSFPIWSAYITAYARIRLYQALEIDPKNLLYCDTDSIFLKNNAQVPTSNKLGQLDLEDDYPVQRAIFVRPKMYYTHKFKCKGANTDVGWEGMLALIDRSSVYNDNFIIEDGVLYEHRFIKLRSSLTRNRQVNERVQLPRNFDMEDKKRVWPAPFTRIPQQSRAIDVSELQERTKDFHLHLPHKTVKPIIDAYLRTNPHVYDRFYGHIPQLRESMADALYNGFELDTIDWMAFDKDIIGEPIHTIMQDHIEV